MIALYHITSRETVARKFGSGMCDWVILEIAAVKVGCVACYQAINDCQEMMIFYGNQLDKLWERGRYRK